MYIHAHPYSIVVTKLEVLQSSVFFSKVKEKLEALIKFEGSVKWEYNSQKWLIVSLSNGPQKGWSKW